MKNHEDCGIDQIVYTMLKEIAFHADCNSITMYERIVYHRWYYKCLKLSEEAEKCGRQ